MNNEIIQLENGQKTLRHFTKDGKWAQEKIFKLLAIREMQMKTIMSYYCAIKEFHFIICY